MKRLILASKSKARNEIMTNSGLRYEVIVSNADEISTKENPKEYVIELSKLKANTVAKTINDGIIISADTIHYFNGKKLEKPKSKEQAMSNLKLLSGETHYVFTGVTIKDLYKNKEISFAEATKVYVNDFSDDEMKWYIDNETNIFERAGGFSLQSGCMLFTRKITGSYNNVLGLPIEKIYSKLKKLGYKISDFCL